MKRVIIAAGLVAASVAGAQAATLDAVKEAIERHVRLDPHAAEAAKDDQSKTR